MPRLAVRLVPAVAALLLPGVAFAHPGLDHTHGFGAGFIHPVTGIDHVLAMVAVGLFAAGLGGRALWLVPASFLGMMALGGALGMAGMTLPFVEAGLGAAVGVLGLGGAFPWAGPVPPAVGLAGPFAGVPRPGHGGEVPGTAGGARFAAGFLLGAG
ncbi:HupE/UreJ family protein, partial [Nostoc sp. NIES-2111]